MRLYSSISVSLHRYNILNNYTMNAFYFNFSLSFGQRAGTFLFHRSRKPLIACLRQEVARLRCQCSPSTHQNRLTAVNSFELFLFNTYARAKEPNLASLTTDHIRAYEQWALRRGLSPNYIRCNLRNLRSLLNRLEPEAGRRLFSGIPTSNMQTDKRSVDEQTVQQLTKLPLPNGTPASRTRDIFLFCLLMMGMPLIDAAFLRRSQMSDGYIVYSRRKTHRQVRVRVTPMLQTIINRLRTSMPTVSPYLLPILSSPDPTVAARQYSAFLQTYNRRLSNLSRRLGLERNLTSYTARHTWASLAYSYGVSPNTISQALCHSNPRTTLAYISDLSNERLDEANEIVTNNLLGGEI